MHRPIARTQIFCGGGCGVVNSGWGRVSVTYRRRGRWLRKSSSFEASVEWTPASKILATSMLLILFVRQRSTWQRGTFVAEHRWNSHLQRWTYTAEHWHQH